MDLVCNDSLLMLHIPIYAYRDAWNSAAKEDLDPRSVAPQNSGDPDNWKDGYQGSFGVKYEGICSYPADEGAFALIKELGSTKHVVCGHDHINNYAVEYEGVKLIYSLKAGAGCYWDPVLNGGTVIEIGSEGVSKVWHEYVDVSEFL
jgi:hypothetical protein